MPRFLISFQVEQLLSGQIAVDAVSPEAAARAFYCGDYDETRLAARLDLQDSEDAIVEIRACYYGASV